MNVDHLGRAADALLTIIPLYHKHVIRTRHSVSGIQVARYRTLGALMKGDILPMSELGQRLYISRPYMTALADSLIRDGLVERHPDSADRRVINLTITPAGRKYLKDSISQYRDDLKEHLQPLDNQDLSDLCGALDEVNRVLSKISP